MHVIIFLRREAVANWMRDRLQPLDVVTLVTPVFSIDEYLAAARNIRTFAVIVGHVRAVEYLRAEQILEQELIVPHRKILNTATITTEIIDWAQRKKFDCILDPASERSYFVTEVQRTLSDLPGPMTIPAITTKSTISCQDEIDEIIVQLISAGSTNSEIADRLQLSIQMVRNRISRILEESGARNRTHLAVMFFANNSLGS